MLATKANAVVMVQVGCQFIPRFRNLIALHQPRAATGQSVYLHIVFSLSHQHLHYSYYASKACSYTDASGRPVPAPRPFKVERPDADNRSLQSSTSSSHNPGTSTHDREHSEDDGWNTHLHPHPQNNGPRKRFRGERGNAIPTDDISAPPPLPMMDPPIPMSLERPDPVELDHSLTRELTNRMCLDPSFTHSIMILSHL